jgi:hypothetical protein
MPRQANRLVALLTLGAFLCANMPAATAALLRLLPGPAERHAADACCGAAHPVRSDSVECPCHHWRHAESAPGDGEDDEPCPACPDDTSCPCPGGCAVCSVAKVPCTGALPFFHGSAPCLGESVPDAPNLYSPPFDGKSPRA